MAWLNLKRQFPMFKLQYFGKFLIFCDESKLFHLVLQNENRRNNEHFGHFSEGQNYQRF